MKASLYHHNTAHALSDPVTAAYAREFVAVSEDAPVPSFAEKSDNQPGLDLVQPLLNALFADWLSTLGWDCQTQLKALTDGAVTRNKSFDFTRPVNEQFVAAEVQFGNQGRMQADFAKMAALHKLGLLKLGILVYFTEATAATADSGLATYEQALESLDELDDMPLLIIGLSREGARTIDMRQHPDLFLPSVMGGKGVKGLNAFLARALLEEQDLPSLVLPANLKRGIARHAKKYYTELSRQFAVSMSRLENCRNETLKLELQSDLTQLARHSLTVPALSPASSKAAVRARRAAPSRAKSPSTAVEKPATASPGALVLPALFPDTDITVISPQGLGADLLMPSSCAPASSAKPSGKAYRVPRESLQPRVIEQPAAATLGAVIKAARGPSSFAMAAALQRAARAQ